MGKHDNLLREQETRHQVHPMVHPAQRADHLPQIVTPDNYRYLTDIGENRPVDDQVQSWGVIEALTAASARIEAVQ